MNYCLKLLSSCWFVSSFCAGPWSLGKSVKLYKLYVILAESMDIKKNY
jgi:hypothetical protein